MAVVVMGRASWRVEIAASASTISMRALPLQTGASAWELSSSCATCPRYAATSRNS